MNHRATILALLSVAIWSFLAYFGSQLNHIPSFLLVGISLMVSGLASLFSIRSWRIPWRTLAVGVGGIFGYHFLLFSAFKYAPAVEANLINYLWPLLIVVLSPIFFPGYALKPYHLIGALIGLFGVSLIVSGGAFQLDLANLKGYLLAAAAALVWACYSLMTKRLPKFPTAAVGLFCLLSGVLSLCLYYLQEQSLQLIGSLGFRDWIFLLLTGAGPLGLAFFTWDAALKQGDPRIIGSLSYLTPLLSTLNLVLWAGKPLSVVSAIAMCLIVGGAMIGSWDLFRKSKKG